MKIQKQERQMVVSFRVSKKIRALLEMMAAKFTLERKKRHTLTGVVEEAITLLAEKERMINDGG